MAQLGGVEPCVRLSASVSTPDAPLSSTIASRVAGCQSGRGLDGLVTDGADRRPVPADGHAGDEALEQRGRVVDAAEAPDASPGGSDPTARCAPRFPPTNAGLSFQLPVTESSTGLPVANVRAWAHDVGPPLSFSPHTRNEYELDDARPVTFSENGPLAPSGQRRSCVYPTREEPVSQYSKWLRAGPLLAVPRAFSVADSGPTFVAGSVDA